MQRMQTTFMAIIWMVNLKYLHCHEEHYYTKFKKSSNSFNFALSSQEVRFKARDKQGLGLELTIYYEEI